MKPCKLVCKATSLPFLSLFGWVSKTPTSHEPSPVKLTKRCQAWWKTTLMPASSLEAEARGSLFFFLFPPCITLAVPDLRQKRKKKTKSNPGVSCLCEKYSRLPSQAQVPTHSSLKGLPPSNSCQGRQLGSCLSLPLAPHVCCTPPGSQLHQGHGLGSSFSLFHQQQQVQLIQLLHLQRPSPDQGSRSQAESREPEQAGDAAELPVLAWLRRF